MIYGHDKTIHRTEYLDVEVDRHGNVVSVWFRCLALPFKQSLANESRSEEMRRMYDGSLKEMRIFAIETNDFGPSRKAKKGK